MVLIIGGLSVAVLLVAWLFRRRWIPVMLEPLICPVVLKRWQLLAIVALPVLAICTSLAFNAHERTQRAADQRARIADVQRILSEQILTRTQIAGIAQAQAKLAQPSTREQLRRINRALMVCAAHGSCREAFVRTVNKIIRSPAGRLFTPAPRDGSVPSVPPPKTIIVQGTPGKPGAPGQNGRDGQAGLNGKQGGPGEVNSNIIDGLDNRVASLEGGLQSLVSRVAVLDRLVTALCHLLTPSKC
jgi:hypothetical protein